ncbi:MAG: efflux transporter outer membrane subunit [Chitinophagaceae bacterium]|nr:MAG: efflux transporter outer membrane subunit [Chitinophagaceae bacterium]
MKTNKIISIIGFVAIYFMVASCKAPAITQVADTKVLPSMYVKSKDTTNAADMNWKDFFNDKNLISLIDTALHNNQDALITLQEIEIAKNNFKIKSSLLLPRVNAGGGLGLEKVGLYTSQGAGDASADITPGNKVPDNLTNINLGFQASWEADIWGKLQNTKKAAWSKYLSTVEGRNLVITNLVAEVADTYYELIAYDNQLDLIRQNIALQQKQLEIVKVQKQAAVVTELAVKQFEAQLLNAQAVEFDLLQKITETENKINFLLGRYPQTIQREFSALNIPLPKQINTGIPAQLLKNRPDIKQAELELEAAKFDVKAAQLEFYPSLSMNSGIGLQAFKSNYILKTPQSLAYSLAGDLTGPIINRTAIMAQFKTANALQIEALYNYQKSIINGVIEVSNELSNVSNLQKMYQFKSQESETLNKAIYIASDLFKSARANYLEVLMNQKDALVTKLELIEAKKRQFNAMIHIYKALGGGWK